MEEKTQRHGGLDRAGRVRPLRASRARSVRVPGGDGRREQPDGDVASTDQRAIIGGPVLDVVLKEILNGPVHREKPLRVGGGFEPPHLVLPLPGRLVGDFRPIVRVPVRTVDHRRHHGPAGRGVTSQLVGDQSSGDAAVPFQQLSEEAYGRSPIAPGLHLRRPVTWEQSSEIGSKVF